MPLFAHDALMNSILSSDLVTCESNFVCSLNIFSFKSSIFSHLVDAKGAGGERAFNPPPYLCHCGGQVGMILSITKNEGAKLPHGLLHEKMRNKILRKFQDRVQNNCIFGSMAFLFYEKGMSYISGYFYPYKHVFC